MMQGSQYAIPKLLPFGTLGMRPCKENINKMYERSYKYKETGQRGPAWDKYALALRGNNNSSGVLFPEDLPPLEDGPWRPGDKTERWR